MKTKHKLLLGLVALTVLSPALGLTVFLFAVAAAALAVIFLTVAYTLR